MVERQPGQGALFSKTVQAGRRTYFFDVKEARNQEKYLTISESRLVNGGRERFRLIVFHDSLPQFTAAMGEAAGYFNKETPRSR